jgi:hypothetical protein
MRHQVTRKGGRSWLKQYWGDRLYLLSKVPHSMHRRFGKRDSREPFADVPIGEWSGPALIAAMHRVSIPSADGDIGQVAQIRLRSNGATLPQRRGLKMRKPFVSQERFPEPPLAKIGSASLLRATSGVVRAGGVVGRLGGWLSRSRVTWGSA